jgi:Protein of unknown function (DUF4238)
MPQNKRHHYVPRFYLRNFSSTGGQSIDIYNIRRGLIVNQGNLARQCYRDYFYGKTPAVEQHFAKIEANAANIIRSAIVHGQCPKKFSQEHLSLIAFIALQHSRTTYAEAAVNEQIDKLAKATVARHLEGIEKVKISMNDAVMFSIRQTLLVAPVLYDLNVKLLIADSACRFITSDNPVVLYNHLYGKERKFGTVGFSCVGLQIFLPISPRHSFIFFDGGVYRVGSPRHQSIAISPSDVVALNEFQWYNALENLYFTASDQNEVMNSEARRLIPRRAREKVKFTEHPLPDTPEHHRIFLQVAKPYFKPTGFPTVISLRRRRGHQNRQGLPPPRDPIRVRIVKDFSEAVDDGRAKGTDFTNFVAGHPLIRRLEGRAKDE